MSSARHRTSSRPVLAAAALALAAAVLAQAPVTSQSSAEGSSAPATSVIPGTSTAPGASTVPAISPVPVDVGSITWKQSKKSKGFGPRDGSPLAFDMAVNDAGRFLLVGVDSDRSPHRMAVVFGSDDGSHWTKLTGTIPKGSSASTVIATDGGFLIVGDVDSSGPLLLTSDGTTVTTADAPQAGLPTGMLASLARTPFGLVAPGTDATGAVTIWASADGVAWTGTPVPEALYIIHVAVADDGTIVTLGIQQDSSGARIPTAWSSTDGTTWTPTPLPVEPGVWSVPDLEATPVGLFATVVTQGQGLVFRTTDGRTWTQVLETPSVATVGTAGTEAVLFGQGTWWHSADGLTWSAVATKSFGDYRIETSAVRGDGAVIAAGYLFSGMTAVEPTDSVRTWVGAASAR